MGIASFMIQEDYFEDYLRMRCEAVDMSELTRRMVEEIYDKEEFNLAMSWVKEYCKEGEDINREEIRHDREQNDTNWETVVKMTLIIRDLMIGNEKLNRRTDPTWPTTWFVPNLTAIVVFKDVYSVMNNWGSNHGVLSFGHAGDTFISLAFMLRIPVSMHNTPEERVFCPSAWAAFGTGDLEGADYRACENFGPMFGKTH